MIAGAQKAGTSSFYHYLAQHPEVCAHAQSEFNYFVNDREFGQGYEHALGRYFPDSPAGCSCFIAKSVEIMYSRKVMERLAGHNKDVQLVVILRHPVERAYSAYWFARRQGWENIPDFETAVFASKDRFGDMWVAATNCAYLDRSLYGKHLQELWHIFSRDQVHVYLFEDMWRHLSGICQSMYQLLGLDPGFLPDTSQRHNRAARARSEKAARMISSATGIKRFVRSVLPDRASDKLHHVLRRLNEQSFSPPPLPHETRVKLIEFFKPHNQELSELLGCRLDHWND